jgi:Protein of unknown function (DUF3108)
MVNLLTRFFVLTTILTAAALTAGVSGQATAPSQATRPTASHSPSQASIGAGSHIQPLRPGFDFPRQTLRYEAEYRYWTAGIATLRVERTGNQEHVSGSLRDTVITFDYSRGKAVLAEKNLKDNQSKRTENDIPGCVTDVVSGLLYVASLPLLQGATYSFPLNDGGKTVTINAHVEGKEQIKTPAGTFQTIRVGPEGDYSVLKNRGRIWIWYSDDERHLPVQIRAKLFWGTLTVYLASIEK